ncbi:TIM barrel protein [candidate division KSB1 bacterium]|nr:TIM barrel protein [candidate division KSB1 bacterium]
MQRRRFIRNISIAMASMGGLEACENVSSCNNISWAMGWILWRGYDQRDIHVKEALKDLSELGAEGIELSLREKELKKFNLTLEKAREMVDQNGLQVSGHYFSDPFYDHSKKAEIRAAFQEKIDSLGIFNAKHIIIGPPKNKGTGERMTLIRQMAPVLDELGKIALDQGVEIGIHPHLKTLIEAPEDIHAIMELTDPRYVLFSPDTGHIHLGGGDVVEILTTYRERLNYFHFKDAVRPFERPDFSPNLRELGKGEIDFKAIMQLLRGINYQGWINIEQDKTTLTPRKSAETSMQYIDQTLKKIYC